MKKHFRQCGSFSAKTADHQPDHTGQYAGAMNAEGVVGGSPNCATPAIQVRGAAKKAPGVLNTDSRRVVTHEE